MTTELDGYGALRQTQGAVYWDRAAVRVAGPDAEKYLQGQASQDVARLAQGSWAWSLVLQPQGKLDAFARVWRAGPEEFVLDTDAEVADALVARLLRFRLRTKADVDKLDWRFVAVRGPQATAPPESNADVAVIGFAWGELGGYDLAGPAVALPPGVAQATAEDHRAVLVEAGFPRHGAELDERTIPAEAGLVGPSVSFTKGCYTGQELVARIDSRGNNVPRRLVGVMAEGALVAGAHLYLGAGEEVSKGRVTSSVCSPRLGPVGLAYLGRATAVDEKLWADNGGDSRVEVRAVELPF